MNYILEDGKPKQVEDALTWARWFEKADRHLAKDELGDILVSTVFLGIDHNFGDGPPVLWETMIFGGEHNEYQERYTSAEEAQEGHDRAIALVKSAQ